MANHDAQSTDHRRLLWLLIVLLVVGPLLWLSGMALLTTVVVAAGPRPTPPDLARHVVRDAGAPPDARRPAVTDASVPDAGPLPTGPSFE